MVKMGLAGTAGRGLRPRPAEREQIHTLEEYINKLGPSLTFVLIRPPLPPPGLMGQFVDMINWSLRSYFKREGRSFRVEGVLHEQWDLGRVLTTFADFADNTRGTEAIIHWGMLPLSIRGLGALYEDVARLLRNLRSLNPGDNPSATRVLEGVDPYVLTMFAMMLGTNDVFSLLSGKFKLNEPLWSVPFGFIFCPGCDTVGRVGQLKGGAVAPKLGTMRYALAYRLLEISGKRLVLGHPRNYWRITSAAGLPVFIGSKRLVDYIGQNREVLLSGPAEAIHGIIHTPANEQEVIAQLMRLFRF